MALAAVSCAILGILTVFTGFFSLAFGSLAVLFAFLSQETARSRNVLPDTHSG